MRGYVNRLRNAADFRQLIVDAFAEANSIRPLGRQIRPGVWAGVGARIDRGSRIVAPAYIGAGARIGKSALVTRCSNIERGSFIDCGTVVENASVLPSSYVGAGLDVCHAVLGYRRIAHLHHKVEIEVHDHRLLAPAPRAAAWRIAAMTAAAMEFLRQQWDPAGTPAPVAAPQLPPPIAVDPEPAELASDGELRPMAVDGQPAEYPTNVAVMRRYGNQ
jgi:carbonic anhydrase/acetyltransferase-like protein (isoleucine patch superfamily)